MCKVSYRESMFWQTDSERKVGLNYVGHTYVTLCQSLIPKPYAQAFCQSLMPRLSAKISTNGKADQQWCYVDAEKCSVSFRESLFETKQNKRCEMT